MGVKSGNMYDYMSISMCMCDLTVSDWLVMNRHLLCEVRVVCHGVRVKLSTNDHGITGV